MISVGTSLSVAATVLAIYDDVYRTASASMAATFLAQVPVVREPCAFPVVREVPVVREPRAHEICLGRSHALYKSLEVCKPGSTFMARHLGR